MNAPASSPTPRHDGWTVKRQEAFLKALARTGCVTHACAHVGMSRESAYKLHDRPTAVAFREAWHAALDNSLHLLEEAATSRSIHGVPRPIFHKGEQVGEWRHFDERLTMFLLRYRRAQRFGAALDSQPLVDPQEDDPIGRLDWNLGELTDEGQAPEMGEALARARKGVNFVNFDRISDADGGGDSNSDSPSPA